MSKIFDYIKNGGDELARAEAEAEYTGACLRREIEINEELRQENERLRSALEQVMQVASGNAYEIAEDALKHGS